MSHGRCDPGAGEDRCALVLGATSVVADPLLSHLVTEGFRVTAVSRQPLAGGKAAAGITWEVGDLAGGWTSGEDSPVVLHLAPLWLLPSLVGPLARRGLRRLVAFGSTSRYARARSSNATDRELAGRLARAEIELDRTASDHGVRWTVFRPTLIYGGGRDRSVTAMAAFARRFGFIPVAGRARGRRQPVRAEDLAEACLAVLQTPATFDRAYDLPGGETLTFHEMAERITLAVLGKRKVVRLPSPVFRGLILVASRLPSLSHLTPEMADRMNEDLVFDASDARRDFSWDPGPFTPPTDGPVFTAPGRASWRSPDS